VPGPGIIAHEWTGKVVAAAVAVPGLPAVDVRGATAGVRVRVPLVVTPDVVVEPVAVVVVVLEPVTGSDTEVDVGVGDDVTWVVTWLTVFVTVPTRSVDDGEGMGRGSVSAAAVPADSRQSASAPADTVAARRVSGAAVIRPSLSESAPVRSNDATVRG
jgi:hypothetical protein